MEKAVPARPAVGERVRPGGSAGQGRASPLLTGDRATPHVFSLENLCEVRAASPKRDNYVN